MGANARVKATAGNNEGIKQRALKRGQVIARDSERDKGEVKAVQE